MRKLTHLPALAFAITLMLPLQQVHAQEKQSDATWAETKGFINKYKNYIKEVDEYISFTNKYDVRVRFNDRKIVKFSISKNYWVNLKVEADEAYTSMGGDKYSTDLDFRVSFNLYYLDTVRIDHNSISLYTTGDQISKDEKIKQYKNGQYFESETNEDKSNYVKLIILDDEMRPRLLNAFQHLAYLANEKRKEDRLKSGDAF